MCGGSAGRGSERAEFRIVEQKLSEYALAADISLRLRSAYQEIEPPAAVVKHFRDQRRADIAVTLNSPGSRGGVIVLRERAFGTCTISA
jgi:hypothetical protein